MAMLNDISPEEMSLAEQISLLPESEQVRWLELWYEKAEAEYGDGSIGIESLKKNWGIWARPEQKLPDHDNWDIFLCLAGRGSGKTRLAAEAVHERAMNKGWHISLIGETSAEVRDVMIEGPSGLKATEKPWNPIRYEPSKRRVTWLGTGTWATTYSGDEPNQLRGPNSNFAWVDEIAKFKYPKETWDNLEMVLRAGEHPQCVVSTTPRPIEIIKGWAKDSKDKVSGIISRTWSTFRNAANLAKSFLRRMRRQYEGTRLGRQELHAEILEDTEGALWRLSDIDKHRINYMPAMRMIAVGVDPPSSIGGTCGIVVMGLSGEELYCLDDMSMKGQPEEWGAQVISAYHKWEADMVVPERNQGGDMVMSTIRAIDPTVPMHPEWASRGKRTRAEPVSTYAEKGAIHHIGAFAELEDEMCTWVPDDMDSPDRMDAYVWAATYLMRYTPYGLKSRQARSF